MHELSLALEVCRIAEASAENFRFCLEALLSDVPFAGARAELTTLPGTDLRVTHLEVDDGRPDD